MTVAQRTAIVIGVFFLLVVTLWPPWYGQYKTMIGGLARTRYSSAGRHLVTWRGHDTPRRLAFFTSPSTYESGKNTASRGPVMSCIAIPMYYRIDRERLMNEWFGIGLLMVLAWAVLENWRKPRKQATPRAALEVASDGD